jgi:hypothetical protein
LSSLLTFKEVEFLVKKFSKQEFFHWRILPLKERLISILHELFVENRTLLDSFYEARIILRPVGNWKDLKADQGKRHGHKR